MMDTSSNPTSHLSFVGLPPEIRLKIYEILMVSDSEVNLFRRRKPSLGSQLLRVRRQIYQEASPVLYGHNVFGVSAFNFSTLRYRVGAHNMAQMRIMRLHVGTPEGATWWLPSKQELAALADAGVFKCLQVFDCVFENVDGPMDLDRRLRQAKLSFTVLVDRPDLPNLIRLSLCKVEDCARRMIYRLDSST
jgi:hypothetical protein